MTTDTKVVARWDFDVEVDDYEQFEDGNYVLFTDHERVVGELAHLNFVKAEVIRDFVSDIEVLKSSLAASRAEVEGLKKLLGETAQCLADVSNDVGGWAVEEVIESAMNAAMEKGNVIP